MIIYFLPIPIITSIVGISLTLSFHVNYSEYQKINTLYKMEHSYATHEFIFYKDKSFDSILEKYNNFDAESKKVFIINSLKLNDVADKDVLNIPYFKDISLSNIKEYISLIRNNQSIKYWTQFKSEKIANYLYFKWTAFTTADYLAKVSSLNFVKASNSGFISGTVVLSVSIFVFMSILTYYYFSKKNGYEKDMMELGYDVSVKNDDNRKIEFSDDKKISLKEKNEIIDTLSKNKEVIDFQNKNSNLGFKNKFLQPKNSKENITASKIIRSYKPVNIDIYNTRKIDLEKTKKINNVYNTRKIDLENTKKINLFQKQLEKSNKQKKISFFKKMKTQKE